ncbi:hypothetical protein DPMN_084200 [Dreissena polymorpha]|uniref:Uncharacterized protein n=1 Tax=Dreissena polymorpha TaxID=45954 RepID=A0A9D3YEF6_DREPO|nr:hypothetical protein DPMN_084200 [Dreissena polymorpha]
MALMKLWKKTLAKKERRGKRKFFNDTEKSETQKKTTKTRLRRCLQKQVVDNNKDEDMATCMGSGCSWKEDEELGLGKTEVNCDFCMKWIHTDCC